MRDRFVLAPRTYRATANQSETVRVDGEAYNLLVEMANSSNLNLRQIVSKAIVFAYEHLEYRSEEENQQEEELS